MSTRPTTRSASSPTSTAEAVAGVLRMFLPDGIELGEAEVVAAGTPPLDGVSVPAVAADVVLHRRRQRRQPLRHHRHRRARSSPPR